MDSTPQCIRIRFRRLNQSKKIAETLQQEFDFGEKLANHIVDEHVRGRAGRNALGVVQTIFVGNLQRAEHVEIVGDYPYGSIIVTDQLLAVDNVFLSGLRIRLFKNALLVCHVL